MKKLAKLFLLVLVFALMASVLVACGEDKTTTHVHAFGEWEVITNPTCTTKGLKKRICKCGEEETEEIKALGHDIIHHEGKEPTCTEEGYKAYDTCSRCDYTTYETLPITHRYNDWQVSASPTCTSGGIETRACSVCGTIERRSVDALGHNYGEWKTTKEPTCTETGEKESICSRCNDVQKQTLSALGHSFGDWVVTKEATCQKGSEERACSVCGYVERKDIPADYTTHIFEGDFCTVCGEHKGTEGLQFELVTNDIVAVTGYTGSSTTVYIPSSYVGATVTSIKAEAFKDNTTITEIVIPESVTSIGSNAFSGCPIETATIPAFAISYILKDNLKTVVITSGESIEYNAFYNCRSLTSITIPDSVTSIGVSAFRYCISLTSITLGNSVTSIGDWAFENCYNLTRVYYTGDIASWCGITFGYYYSNPLRYAHNLYINNELIKEIVIPDTVTGIKADAFSDWNGTSITIPDGVTSIGNGAFSNCSSLTSITIPDSVTSIGYGAFYGCSSLTSITIPDSVTSIGNSAFYGCSSLTSITLGNSVMSIGSNAFNNCSRLTSITIPNSVTSIGEGAFLVCRSLTSITIPDSVTSIGGSAFRDCGNLTSVYYTGDIATWCGITFGRYESNPLFYAHNLYINNELIKDIVIPDTVTEIKDYAFRGWNGTSITIPDSVTRIGDDAFYYCESLTSITFQGTKAQWNAISKGDNWDYYTGNYTVHCTDDI